MHYLLLFIKTSKYRYALKVYKGVRNKDDSSFIHVDLKTFLKTNTLNTLPVAVN